MSSQLKAELRPPDLRTYQTFWATMSPALVQRYRGKSVAVQLGEAGWQIVDGADDLLQLRDSLLASGVDMNTIVLDRIPCDEEDNDWVGGVQLQ